MITKPSTTIIIKGGQIITMPISGHNIYRSNPIPFYYKDKKDNNILIIFKYELHTYIIFYI